MKIKERVLEKLNINANTVVSGGELARELGVTRNSVWKAINQLKREGYNITSHSNQGYALNGMVDILNKEEIASNLPSGANILLFDCIKLRHVIFCQSFDLFFKLSR